MVKSDTTTATFTLVEPGQYSVEGSITTRFENSMNNVVLFLFANKPETERPKEGDPNVIYLKAGIHHQNIDLKSGQTLYLEAGAVLFGGINVWDARDVKILGRGVVFYYGPQSENRDDGRIHRKNWHPLTTNNCEGLTVSGVTFVGRSRTWTIQMHSTFDAAFDNVKVLGVNNQNVNGDGFDFMGGGRIRITNSLVRSGDDAFAFFTPRWAAGYEKEVEINEKYKEREEIKDVRIENCVIWPTRANICRVGVPKIDNLAIINCDIIHVPLGYLDDSGSLIRGGSGSVEASNFLFENIRFEEPAALLGLGGEASIYRNIVFKNITMKGEPIPLIVRGTVDGLVFDNVILNGKLITAIEDVPFEVITKEIKNLKFVKSK